MWDQFSLGARAISTLACNAFFGSALYISVCEVPARRALGTAPAMVEHFQESFPRAKSLQGKLAFIGFMGAGLSWLTQDHPQGWLLLAASLCQMFVWPWTLAVIMPVNNQLMDGEAPKKKGDMWAADMLDRWGSVHLPRTVASGAAVLCLSLYWVTRAEGRHWP